MRGRAVRVGVLAAAALGLVGCGSSQQVVTSASISPAAATATAPTETAATRCPSGLRVAAAVRLVLSDRLPVPHLRAVVGEVPDVISPYVGAQMQFPGAHPAFAVCAVSQHQTAGGTTSVRYRLLHAGSIYFSATYVRATDAEMPAMGGRVVVSGARHRS